MAGVSDRVRGFIQDWPVIEKQLEEVLKEDEGSLRGEPEDE